MVWPNLLHVPRLAEGGASAGRQGPQGLCIYPLCPAMKDEAGAPRAEAEGRSQCGGWKVPRHVIPSPSPPLLPYSPPHMQRIVSNDVPEALLGRMTPLPPPLSLPLPPPL